jgi:carbon-monoxide dehydrogenase medium subunit
MYTHSTDAGWISRSHAAIRPFRLRKPSTAEDALAALAEPGSVAIAGGIDLIRRMRGGDAHDILVDLSAISAMRGIRDEGDRIRIGALTSHWDIETADLLAARLPDFQRAWTTIGNVRVRMAGTVGGNLMAAESGYDGRVLLGVLGATLEFATAGGTVSVPAASPSGWPEGGLLLSVGIPAGDGTRLSFDRSLKPVVSVAVALSGSGDEAVVGAGCAYPTPCFRTATGTGEGIESGFPEPAGNAMGSAGYRRRMIGVLARRQIAALREGT